MKYKLKIEVMLNKEEIDQMGKVKNRSIGHMVWSEHIFNSSAGCPPGVLKILHQRKDFNTSSSSKHLKK